MMSYRASLLLAAAGLWGIGASSSVARAQSIPVTVGPNASSLVGVDFELPVTIDMSARSEKLGSFALTVRWNPSVLEMVGGHDGNFGSITVNEDSLAAGALIVSGADPAGVGGEVVVVVARLRPLVADSTIISVSVTELFAAGSFADLTADAVASDRSYCPALGRYGDIDGDGSANSRDALIALTAAVGLDVSGFDASLGDVDGDGATKARDALIILSNAVGLDVTAFRVFFVAPGACAVAPTIPGMTIDPGDLTVLAGQRVHYGASATDSSGNSITLTDVFWKTGDERVATVTPDGLAVALDTGTAVISAIRNSTSDSAGVTLTVAPDRTTHWVDALAFNEVNQLGTTAYPFATIHHGVDFAGPGDTVRVQLGRYEPGVMIDKSIVVYGEPLAGGSASGAAPTAAAGEVLPVIAATRSGETGFSVNGGARVELHNFDLDTLWLAVYVSGADTVRMRNLRHRSPPASGWAGIYASSADLLQVEQSQFLGTGGDYLSEQGIYAGGVKVVSVDSSLFAGFGYHAVELHDVDSVYARGSRFLGNDGYGVAICTDCYEDGARAAAVVFSGNRFEGNNHDVYVDRYRSARFDHNVFEMGDEGYGDAIQLYRDSYDGYGVGAPGIVGAAAAGGDSGLVVLLGDSIRKGWGTWLHVEGYDSLAVDSVTVETGGDGGGDSFYGGRIATVTNSKFSLLEWGAALYVEAWPRDSSLLVIRNTEFQGPDSSVCDRCGYGVEGDGVWVDAENVTAVNLYNALESWGGRLDIRNSSFTHNGYDIDAWCSTVSVSNITSFDAWYSIDAYGCSPDTLVVDGSGFTLNNGAVMASYMPTTVTNNVITDSRNAIEVHYGDLVATDNQIVRTGVGIEFDGDSALVATISGNSITCAEMDDGYDGEGESTAENGYGYEYAIEAYDGEMHITDNVIGDCWAGIDVFNYLSIYDLPFPVPVEIRNNAITMPTSDGYLGIRADGPAALVRIVGNGVTGPAEYGSIYAGGFSGVPFAEVDTNTVDGSVEAGIWAQYVDTLRIRDNVVTNHGLATCCVGGRSGAIYLGYSSSTGVLAEVLRNRVTGSKSSGIVLERGSGDTVTVLVDSNTVNVADSVGIWIANYARAVVRKNAVDSAGLDAVQVDRYSSDSTAAVINQNNFTNTGRYAVNNLDVGAIDATSNWWNDALGPSGSLGDPASSGDSVSANVTWSPWLAAPADAPAPARPVFAAAAARRVMTMAPTTAYQRDRSVAPRHGEHQRPQRPARDSRRWALPQVTVAPQAGQLPDGVLEAQRRFAERLQARLEQRERRDAAGAARAERQAERLRALAEKRAKRDELRKARAAGAGRARP